MTCSNWSTTAQMFSSLFEKPKMTEKLLSKPPFKYIFDIFFETSRQTGFAAGLFTAEDQDANAYDVKEKKISFLQKIIDLTGLMLKEQIEAKPSKIVAGLEPDATNSFLQAMYRAAVSLVDSTPFVNQVLAAHNGSGVAPQEQPQQKAPTKTETKDPKPDQSQQQQQQPIKKDDSQDKKKQQDLEKKKKQEEEAAQQAAKEKEEAKKQQEQQKKQQQLEEQKKLDEKKKKDELAKKQQQQQQQEEELARKQKEEQKQKAEQKAQQQREQQAKEAQQKEQLKTEVKVIRPPTAKRPTKQTSKEIEDNNRGGKGAATGVIRDGDQMDDDETENQQDFISSTQNVQNKQQLDMSKQGKFIQNALKDDLDDGAQQQNDNDGNEQRGEEAGGIKMNRLGKKKKKGTEKVGEADRNNTSEARGTSGAQFTSSNAGVGTGENIEALTKLVQAICQNANPLGKSLEFINDDIESMNNELQYWQKQYKSSKEKMVNELRITEETLQPMQDKLAEIKLQIQDQKAKISNVKSQILTNQQTIKQLLMSVVTNKQ